MSLTSTYGENLVVMFSFLHTWRKTACRWMLHVRFWSLWLAEKFGTQLKDVKSCQKLFHFISKPVKRNIKSTFLRIFVSAVGFSGNLLCHSLYNLIWDKNKHDLHCRNTLEKQKWRLYFITREVLDYSACDPQPLNRKLFPVLKYLLTIIFVIW